MVRLLRIKKCEPRGVGFGRRPLLCGGKLLNFRPALLHQGSGTRADPFEVQIPTVGGACLLSEPPLNRALSIRLG